MKTLIVYGSKTGVTEDCAKELSKLIEGEYTLYDVKDKKDVSINEYNNIVIGSSIYAGALNSGVKRFCKRHEYALMNKTLYIYTCGLSDNEEALSSVEKGLGSEIKKHARKISHFGGELRPDNANGFLRLIVVPMSKKVDSSLNKDVIKEFASYVGK